MFSTAFVLAASMVVGQAEGEKAFKAYTDFAVGGVWKTTAYGEEITSCYTRIPDSPFIQIRNQGGQVPFVGVIGVDPSTKACTWWFFNKDGGIGKDVLTQESEKVFMLEGTGIGPKGEIRYKGRITQVDKNTVTEEIIQFSIGAESRDPKTFTWTR